MPKGVRKSITIPGLLAPTVKQRCAEFGHAIFTPYAVELVCYDLRSNAKHSITLEIARDTQPAQDAVDRELVARYRAGHISVRNLATCRCALARAGLSLAVCLHHGPHPLRLACKRTAFIDHS